jgi:hypothetical protein
VILLDEIGIEVPLDDLMIVGNHLKEQNFAQIILTSKENVLLEIADLVIGLSQDDMGAGTVVHVLKRRIAE